MRKEKIMKKFEKEAKITITGRENYADDDAAKFLNFKLWEKGGKKRIYVNDYKRRTLGYIDSETKEWMWSDNNGLTKDQVNAAIEAFKAEYDF